MPNEITLDIYHGEEASVNAYILSDNESIILIDCLRNSKEAQLLADKIKEHKKPLTHILITHGHPDHYLGMNVLKQAFPEVEIVVASEEIKQDISSFSAWMEGVGWLDPEPEMKPKTSKNSSGFDYDGMISVLSEKTLSLAGGAVLQLETNYLPAEADHLTTIFSEDLNAFFSSDFCYNKVHLWLAIEKQNIADWKTQLDELFEKFTRKMPTVYPGHGESSGIELFEEVRNYIIDFENTIITSGSRKEAMNKLKSLYPDYQQADFLLLHSVNKFMPE